MNFKDLERISAVLGSTLQSFPATLTDLLPLFAVVLLMTQRELLNDLLNTEPDWPWHDPQTSKSLTGLQRSRR